MDFTKFVALLEHQALVFPRADKFEDPYECHLSEAAIRQIREGKTEFLITPQQRELWIRAPEHMRKHLFISCWCAAEHESAAMWKLYLSGSSGVSIKTNTSLLAEALEASPLQIGMSCVKYIDYASTSIPLGNALFPALHKRLSFSHESELRAVIWSEITGNEVPPETAHLTIPISPQHLIEAIHVDPMAPSWFGAIVERVASRYGLAAPVVRSNLYVRPTY